MREKLYYTKYMDDRDFLDEIERLECKVKSSETSTLINASTAYKKLDELKGKFIASGIILELYAYGSCKELIPPVTILDGLSDETIDMIKKDLERTIKSKLSFVPKGLQNKFYKGEKND